MKYNYRIITLLLSLTIGYSASEWISLDGSINSELTRIENSDIFNTNDK